METVKLRAYQQKAVDAAYKSWASGKLGDLLIVAPTGSGKSLILGKIVSDIAAAGDRVIVLTHRAELIEQDAKAIKAFTNQKIAINSASLKRREDGNITVAGIQSIYKKIGFYDVVIVDECHLIPRSKNTMYGSFLDGAKNLNPKLKKVGLSATPYRLDSGLLHKGKDAIFDGIAFDIKVKGLIDKGYLVPLRSKAGSKQIDLKGVKKRGGDFIPKDLAAAADKEDITAAAVMDIFKHGEDRKSWLIFASGVEHAYHIHDKIADSEVITGETPQDERKRIIDDFKNYRLRCIINCQVLTTGFDAPNIDLIAMLTATESTGLYVQMLGRGTRIKEGKKDCLILDYGDNVMRHGFFDKVTPNFCKPTDGTGEPPVKMCQKCGELCHAAVNKCEICGFIFPKEGPTHSAEAYNGAIMAGDYKPEEFLIDDVTLSRHKKAGKPDSVKVTYFCKKEGGGNLSTRVFNEWICPEHEGYARKAFEKWWADWMESISRLVADDISLCRNLLKLKAQPSNTTSDLLDCVRLDGSIGRMGKTKIIVDTSGKYPKIIKTI